MLLCDLHVHTRFSVDSEERMEAYCDAALQRGVACVCFADHIDLNEHDMGYGYYDGDAYFAELENARRRYGDKLRLLSGIEIGEPHVYPKQVEYYSAQPYDFVLGSIHWWKDNVFPSQMRRNGVSLEECFDTYWRAVLDMAEFGGFDSLAHLDFPKRYYGDSIEDNDMLARIFTALIRQGIALEINTSSLRKGLDTCMPDEGPLRLYHALGGRRVTVGSDAHTADDLAADFGRARALIASIGLEETVFVGREPHPVEWE